jgi:zinc transporter, ZIP family
MREFMPSKLEIFYIMIATGAGVLGGVVACFWVPKLNARSAIQHFAAGVVIAAVASELIPEVERLGTAVGILSGFAAGGLTMIGIKWLVLRFERLEESRHELPVGLAVAAAVDTLLDGAIISAGFFTQRQLGPLLAIALAVELFFLTLSVGSEFHKSRSQRWRGLATTTGIALLLLVGALGAHVLMKGASEGTVAVVLAFGAAALIYLVAEELLVEAIEAEESLFSTAMLFLGFLVLLALKLFDQSGAEPPGRQ